MGYRYSSESIQQELSNEYQHYRVYMVLKVLCVPELWTKVASALEGLNSWIDAFYVLCDDNGRL